jgi:hypothetical protein
MNRCGSKRAMRGLRMKTIYGELAMRAAMRILRATTLACVLFEATASVDVSNILNEERKKQVIALGRLGWSLLQIHRAAGIRRETAAAYLKEAFPFGFRAAGTQIKTGHKGDRRLWRGVGGQHNRSG